MTKLLITGGAGFIGSNFAHHWNRQRPNDKIVILDKMTYGSNARNLKGLNANVGLVVGDIRNRQTVEEVMEGVDAVVHFAAETHVDHSIENAQRFVETNVLGTYNLLEAVRLRPGVRFHHVSTDEVFGQILEGKFDEHTPYAPRNPYSATKAGADHLVRSFVNTHNINATITNCSNNYGPRQATDKLIPKAIEYARALRPFPLNGGGTQIRDWLHVDDHCKAIGVVLQHGKRGETYLIGGDNELTNLELVRKIYQTTGNTPSIAFIADRPGHDVRYAIDHGKITRELGWVPTRNFDAGLEETVKWYDLLRSDK
jgi:dTDP-glucose 4,6-dehydratase